MGARGRQAITAIIADPVALAIEGRRETMANAYAAILISAGCGIGAAMENVAVAAAIIAPILAALLAVMTQFTAIMADFSAIMAMPYIVAQFLVIMANFTIVMAYFVRRLCRSNTWNRHYRQSNACSHDYHHQLLHEFSPLYCDPRGTMH